MTWDNFLDYLIPVAMLIVYFLFSNRKKETAQGAYEEEVPKEPLPLPPIPKKVQPPIKRETIDSPINTRDFSTSITEERATSLVSDEMRKHLHLDPADAQNPKKEFSRARKLLTSKASLRDAFVLQEILKRPYE